MSEQPRRKVNPIVKRLAEGQIGVDQISGSSLSMRAPVILSSAVGFSCLKLSLGRSSVISAGIMHVP